MEIRQITSPEDIASYDRWIKAHPEGTLWQSLEWKKYQEALGRETRLYAALDGSQIVASALVIVDRTAMGLCTWDVPRGPLAAMDNGQWTMDNFLSTIVNDAQKDKCMTLYLSPLKNISIVNFQLSIVHSARHEQPEATRILDLTKSEEEILAQMKPKGRYNIGVAEKNGVTVKRSEDVEGFFHLLKGTGDRDRFSHLPLEHYQTFLKELPQSFLLLAYHPSPTFAPCAGATVGRPSPNPSPIAGLIGITWNHRALYYYGASSYADRALMAPYLLQWEAIKECKRMGCHSYDLLGVAPPRSVATDVAPIDAEADHPWKGISAFKEKFGGTMIVYPKEQRIVLRRAAGAMLRMKRKLLG